MTDTPPVISTPPHALTSQVGGHAGVLTTEDGSLLIKPALPLELTFYESLQRDEAFAPLRPFIPKFLGTLKLEGEAKETAGEGITLEPVEGHKDSLVLENLSFPYSKPNILDIKLGTVLYDDSASAEKVARMVKTAQDTTSFESGVRLTGFQVHDNTTGLPVNTPKAYGKSIKVADLPDGIARFFPIGVPSISSPDSPPTDLPTPTNSGLPAHNLLPILQSLRGDIAEIREAFTSIHMRMVGASLLIVYEADWDLADAGVKKYLSEDAEGMDEDESEEESEDEAEGAPKKIPPPYVVKLIDFAHTKIMPGKGPDEGVLRGIDTVLSLLDGRIAEVQEAMKA
ncbi:hypothetical protein BDQ12DRAFT_692302 [Crucibulum laeve]|uniref:Kinase n=1 Tax=Crucibulum laeve TaxID=68775 RepID=A0A5C3LHN4_9AGAR|nr:hypothetical protein BDQ12DRAFT_692302 [Crucibulum laeve]